MQRIELLTHGLIKAEGKDVRVSNPTYKKWTEFIYSTFDAYSPPPVGWTFDVH
jgi:hypothetical protein